MNGQIRRQKCVYRGKSVKNMEIEQWYVIKFFTDEGMPAVGIIYCLRNYYGEDALSNADLFCINKRKCGRTDFNNIASPGREPDEGLADIIAAKLDTNPHLSARRLAQSLRIAASTVCRYLTEVLGMECRHLRWARHALTAAQKVVHVELAERMLQALAKHERSHFHFLFTGDKP
jgi:hypothetical protein